MTTQPDPHEYIRWRGVTIDRRTAAALAVAEQRLGYELTVIKAHNVAGAGSVSATTHNGTGVCDLAPYDAVRKRNVLEDIGFAVYRRYPDEGPWAQHLHVILRGPGHGLDPAAQRQVDSWLAGRNGLVSNRPDRDQYRPSPMPRPFNYAAWWNDGLLDQKISGLRARRKRLAERISALRARRKTLGAEMAAAKKKKRYS